CHLRRWAGDRLHPPHGMSVGDRGDTTSLAPQGQPSLARTGHPVQAFVLPRRSVRAAGWHEGGPLASRGLQTAACAKLGLSADGGCHRREAAAERARILPALLMTSIDIGDLVELRDGAAWLGSVLDVVDGPPRCLLVYWYTPPKLCINPVLENEAWLALAMRDETRVERARRAA